MTVRKKIIFVGGASYSGTTVLDMMLANHEAGFSCGEVVALFHPHKIHHVHFKCGCGDDRCDIWEVVKHSGPSNIYKTIFERNPDVTYIVDSSKDPCWISRRSKECRDQGYDVANVLIWKTPASFRTSWMKRHAKKDWQKAWQNYHQVYFSAINNWISYPYAELVRDAETLSTLSKALELPPTESREEYWQKQHHTLFGNSSAKIHLYGRDSANFNFCIDDMAANQRTSSKSSESSMVGNHRKISESDNSEEQLLPPQTDSGSHKLLDIISVLSSRDYRKTSYENTNSFPPLTMTHRFRLKMIYFWWLARRLIVGKTIRLLAFFRNS